MNAKRVISLALAGILSLGATGCSDSDAMDALLGGLVVTTLVVGTVAALGADEGASVSNGPIYSAGYSPSSYSRRTGSSSYNTWTPGRVSSQPAPVSTSFSSSSDNSDSGSESDSDSSDDSSNQKSSGKQTSSRSSSSSDESSSSSSSSSSSTSSGSGGSCSDCGFTPRPATTRDALIPQLP